jgi:hypothetical protein
VTAATNEARLGLAIDLTDLMGDARFKGGGCAVVAAGSLELFKIAFVAASVKS